MKKLYLLLGVLAVFCLHACGDGKATTDEDVGIVDPESLIPVIHTMTAVDNYRIDINIDMDFMDLDSVMLFDGKKVYYELLGETYFSNREADVCHLYEHSGTGFEKTVVDCIEDDDGVRFFTQFQHTHFIEIEGVYHLKEAHHDLVEAFVQETMPEAQVLSFVLSTSNTRFERMVFTVDAGGEIFIFDMAFSRYGQVNVTLPEVD